MKRVLIIENNLSVGNFFSSIRNKNQDCIFIVPSGEEALQVIEKEDIDLVCIGLDVPGIENNGLLKKIRERKSCDELPVVSLQEVFNPGLQKKTIKEIIDSIPVIIVLVDEEFKVISANSAAVKFTGKQEPDINNIAGGNVFNCINALKGDSGCGKSGLCSNCIIRNSVNHTLTTGESICRKECSFEVLNNGRSATFELLVSTTPIRLSDNKVVLISIDDTTLMKQTFRELQESRDIYAFQAEETSKLMEYLDIANDKLQSERDIIEGIFNSSSIGIGITDINGKYIMSNNWWTEHLGYSKDEIMSMTNLQVTHPDDREETIRLFRELTEGRSESYRIDKRFIRKDGTIFWGDLSVSVIRDKENIVSHIIGIIRDITEIREANDKLQRSENALKEAQKIGNTAHWEFDLVKQKLTWSEQSYRIFEVDPETFSVNYRNVLRLMGNEAKRYSTAFIGSIRKHIDFEIEYSIVTRNNKTKYLVEKAKTSYDKDGKPLITLGTLSDITERKEIELNISRQNLQLKELNATKDKLFSIISHDLRNAFNAILGLSNLLSSEYDSYSREEVKEFIEGIKSTSDTTYALLENLLLWAKSQQSKLSYKPAGVELGTLMNECLSIFENQVQMKGIIIENKISGDLWLYADPDMIKTIIRNLVSNAIKFTPRGSKIEVMASKKLNTAEITVADHGVGMSNEVKNSLFKISDSRSLDGTEGEKGTGLGLILCSEFVEMNGGEIRVESEPGKGSSFIFTVPLFDNQ
jgi:PAS domain S-box-containing protein